MEVYFYRAPRSKKTLLKTIAALVVILLLTTVGAITYTYSMKNNQVSVNKPQMTSAAICSYPGKVLSSPKYEPENAVDTANTYNQDSNLNTKMVGNYPTGIQDIHKKTAFLTFDDGPSVSITPQVLDILKKYDIKATFFEIGMLCEYHPDIVKKVGEEGHLICNHTYSHDYKKDYASVDSFVEDVLKCDDVLKSIPGADYTSNLVRFPGGGYDDKYIPFKKAIREKGYEDKYWDVETGDSEAHNVPVEKLLQNLKKELDFKYIKEKDEIIVLMHDSFDKQTTVEALPEVIEYLKSLGYTFETLRTLGKSQN
jgi:peptidoglycan-N-acetylglucosamine deacetylase